MSHPNTYPESTTDTTTSGEVMHRRRFLRGLGMTLAVGAGVALVPATKAHAQADTVSTCYLTDGCLVGRVCVDPNANQYLCYSNAPGSGSCCECIASSKSEITYQYAVCG